MRRTRKISKLVYNKVKHLPWRTVVTPSKWNTGKVEPPDVTVNDREYHLQIEVGGPFCTVDVRVGGETNYPGGTYTRFWPWAWERTVYKRVVQGNYNVKSVPCDSVIDSDIDALTPSPSLGALSLPPEHDT